MEPKSVWYRKEYRNREKNAKPKIHKEMTDTTTTTTHNKHVGILALEVYTPRTFIAQSELEEHMGVPAGKFTLGLGQQGLAVTGDAEDINSLCLTAVQSLLEK